MRKLNRPNTLALIIALLAPAIYAQMPSAAAVSTAGGSSSKFLPVAEIKEGMHGVAKTVFRGGTPEDFGVEILGVLPGAIGPQQDLIIGRLTNGSPAERTAVFAGMSGSPVYIDGRLVGAISYSFPFAKEPICGITPFEQMAAAVERVPTPPIASAGSRTFTYAELLSNTWQPSVSAGITPASRSFSTDPQLAALAGQTFRPIAAPVTFSGISQKVLEQMSDQFMAAGILPVAAPGGGSGTSELNPATADTLVGGDSVVV